MTSQDHADEKPGSPSQEPAGPAEPASTPADDGEPAPAPLGYHTAADDGPKANTALLTEQAPQGSTEKGENK